MAGENIYKSKYFTAEEIDQRLLQGYYDDVVNKGYTGTKNDFLSDLLSSLANYPNISGTTHIGEFPTIQNVWEVCKQIALDSPEISIIKYSVKQGLTYNSGVVFQSFHYDDHIVTQYYFYGGGQKHECNVRHILTDGTEDTWQPLHIYTSFSFENGSLYGYKYGKSTNSSNKVEIVKIPNASLKSQGLLSKDDKSKLDSLAELSDSYDLNTYTSQGVYLIRTISASNEVKNYPIQTPVNSVLRLTVLDSYDGNNHVITQVLNINNNVGGEGNIYIRSNQNHEWKPWAKLQTNVEVGLIDQAKMDGLTDNGIYSGILSTTGETFVIICINNYAIAQQVGIQHISHLKYSLVVGTGEIKIEKRTRDAYGFWTEWVSLDEKSLVKKEENRAKEAEEKLEKRIANDKTALINGDTIVGLAREVYSRQGKVDTTTFLKRTTAGGTSVSDGVATLKQIGGNIVKNLVDGNFVGAETNRSRFTIDNNNVGKITTDKVDASSGQPLYGDISYNYEFIEGHVYYCGVYVLNLNCESVLISVNGGYDYAMSNHKDEWVFLSYYGTPRTYDLKLIKIRAKNNNIVDANNQYGGNICYVKNWLVVDLTEMFGAGNEPTTKEECDRMFGTMDALPKGLTIAQPTGLKSTGFNQWNPANMLLNKSIVENAIEDDVADRHIAIVECLPCKMGTGENNGYIIGYGEGDSWSVEGIEVYFSPLNPMDYIGQGVDLYMHKLEADSDYGSYVPECKGYLLIVTPTTEKLCVHFHWSGDRATTDYEPYVESNVALPLIPEMSEWGLAGISTSGTMVQDTIDLENNTYTKRIGCVDLGTLTWEKAEAQWNVYVCGEKKIYNPSRLPKEYTFTTLDFNVLNRLSLSYNESDDSITITVTKGNIIAGETYTMAGQVVISKIDSKQIITVKPADDRAHGNVLCVKYNTITRGQCYYGTSMNGVGATNTGRVSIVDSAFSGMTESEIKASLDGLLLYYEMITPEEYPIVTKAAPNYIGSDYGVEEFTGSKVPLAANILFYMRSLVSETRNFLDRLMARLGISDATAVADKIADAILPTTDETEVEPTEVIEE